MNVIRANFESNPMTMYAMTKSPEIISVSKLADGDVLEVHNWLFYDDLNSKEETVSLLSFQDENGCVYATQSDTFKGSFDEILDIIQDTGGNDRTVFTIKKISGTAKSGREYINCVLVDIASYDNTDSVK